MKKKHLWIIIGSAVVLLLLIILLLSGGKKGSSGISTLTLSEKEKYAKFEAEVACDLVDVMKNADSTDANTFIQNTLQIIQTNAAKYGYTESEIEANKAKYENDAEFMELAKNYMLEICPEVANMASSD